MKRLIEDAREPSVWLNYAADNLSPDPMRPMGPTLPPLPAPAFRGEWLWPVTVEARPHGGTRVGFTYQPPEPPL